MISTEAVANWFLNKGRDNGEKINLLTLIKYIYFAHGWTLALQNRPLIDEMFIAADWGVTLLSLQRQFMSRYGRKPIKELATVEGQVPYIEFQDSKLLNIFQRGYRVYSTLGYEKLIHLTVQPGTPWRKTFFELGGNQRRNMNISDELIKKHFLEKAQRNRQIANPNQRK